MSDMLGPKGANFDNDDEVDEDDELLNDPVAQIDIQVSLANVDVRHLLSDFLGSFGFLPSRVWC